MRRWNGKSLVDEITTRLWDTSAASQARVIEWVNEIQNDIVSEIPMSHFKFELKKLLPTEQEIVDLNPQIPTAATTAIASGGSLTDGSNYKVYTSFLIYDGDTRHFIESEAKVSAAVTADASNKTIDLTDIDIYDGDTSMKPATIHRRIYLATDSGSGYGEPFFVQDITDNTTTALSITSEPTSTVTPVSDSEVERITGDHMRFTDAGKVLYRIDRTRALRFNPSGSTSTTPDSFDFVGLDRIFLYPKLASTSTTAQRTLKYTVYRRPHEVFYDVDREIDMPIIAKRCLIEGVLWLAYEFRDRAGKESKLSNYEQMKRKLVNKIERQSSKPSVVRDVNGDFAGFEV